MQDKRCFERRVSLTGMMHSVLSVTLLCTPNARTAHMKGCGEDASPRIRGDRLPKADARGAEPIWKWRVLRRVYVKKLFGHDTCVICFFLFFMQ